MAIFEMQQRVQVPEFVVRGQERVQQVAQEVSRQAKAARCRARRKVELAVGQTRHDALALALDSSRHGLELMGTMVQSGADFALFGKASLARQGDRLVGVAQGLEQRLEGLNRVSVEGYDEMNVNTVKAHIKALDAYELSKVRAYEVSTKNRVTVLREIDRLMSC